jgi:hypothetical protein
MDSPQRRTPRLPLKDHCKMNNFQLAISIKSLNIIANFDMLILQFALIFEKGLGRGRRLASADTSPWENSRGHLDGENVFQGHGCPLPCPSYRLIALLSYSP